MMLLWISCLTLCVAAPILAAPQIGAFQDSVINKEENSKATTVSPIEIKRVDPLLFVASLPGSPANVTDDAQMCASCGKGPLLACPKEGACSDGEACCFDSCRSRQVCRPKSEIVGFKNTTVKAKRDTEDQKSSFAVIDEGLTVGSTRQNPEVPLPSSEKIASIGADRQQTIPDSVGNFGPFVGNSEEAFPAFSPGAQNNFPQFDLRPQGQQNPSPPGPGFGPPIGANNFAPGGNFQEFDDQGSPLISFQQPVIIPHSQNDEGDDDDDNDSFLETLFG